MLTVRLLLILSLASSLSAFEFDWFTHGSGPPVQDVKPGMVGPSTATCLGRWELCGRFRRKDPRPCCDGRNCRKTRANWEEAYGQGYETYCLEGNARSGDEGGPPKKDCKKNRGRRNVVVAE